MEAIGISLAINGYVVNFFVEGKGNDIMIANTKAELFKFLDEIIEEGEKTNG